MPAVSEVLLTNVVEFTVIPVPENDTAAPLTKPAIRQTVTFPATAPWLREIGLVEVTVGAAFTVKTAPEPTPVSRFTIVSVRAPVRRPLQMVQDIDDRSRAVHKRRRVDRDARACINDAPAPLAGSRYPLRSHSALWRPEAETPDSKPTLTVGAALTVKYPGRGGHADPVSDS